MSGNLFSLIEASVHDPARVFLETPEGRTISCGEMLEASGRTANLLARSGVKPGDRVAVQVEKTPEAVILYLACLRAGAAYLPLNTAYTLAELDYFIGDAEPAMVVCSPQARAGLEPVAAKHGVKTVATLDARGEGSLTRDSAGLDAKFATVVRGDDDLACFLYTSGTTGRSKGAMITHGNLASNATALAKLWRFSQSDVLLHALPIFHVHGLFVALNVTLVAGAKLLFLPAFDAAQMIGLFARSTVMMGVPTFYVRLLQSSELTRERVKGMRLFVSGSAPLLAETHRAWQERTGHAILERYGMTETGMNTSNPYDGERVAGTVGFPLPGVELRIVDPETATPLEAGEIGGIEVRGPNIFKGYWKMPEKTQEEIRPDGFFITGDVGLVDERGYLHIVGRSKDLIITGGYNVYPKELENEIDRIDGVVESAVIGVPHPDFGEGVTAVVVQRPGAQVSEKAVLSALAGKLARYKLPKKVIVVDDLPRNAMGKVEKKALRERYAKLYA